MKNNHKDSDSNICSICRNHHEFEFPGELYNSLLAGEVVVFAGAGISTENRQVYSSTFYEDICNELGIDPRKGPSFPDLMSRFSSQTNGRRTLLQRIKKRLDYIMSFPELYRVATRFHRELSTIFQIDTIVTTNWDNYFEQECGATPYVYAEDFAFWNMSGRKVFKIHGSVDSYGSIVATNEDYEKCYERLSTGLLGSNLKMMLATKTILYIGFSFTDNDFLQIHQILSDEMKGLRPHSYIVTLDRNADTRLREQGLTPIYTDGTYFLTIMKEHLIAEKFFISDDRFDGIATLLEDVLSSHFELIQSIDKRQHPDIIYTLSYQDGLIHALERILRLRKTGYYSYKHNLHNTLYSYQDMRKKKLKEKSYFDVAYIDGYLDAHLYLLALDNERDEFWIYYVFGYKEPIPSLNEYIKISKKASTIHKKSYEMAKKFILKHNLNEDINIHHPPFL